MDKVRTHNMSADPPHTSNNAEENYTETYMELVLAQCVSKDTAHFITIQTNYLLSH